MSSFPRHQNKDACEEPKKCGRDHRLHRRFQPKSSKIFSKKRIAKRNLTIVRYAARSLNVGLFAATRSKMQPTLKLVSTIASSMSTRVASTRYLWRLIFHGILVENNALNVRKEICRVACCSESAGLHSICALNSLPRASLLLICECELIKSAQEKK